MQEYAKSQWRGWMILLLLPGFLLLAYLPVASFQFFIKNDAFNGYFPPKFFMSESLQAGYLPLWNPYINFGIPQYGDMNAGYWHPFTWIIAATCGYNAYSFTLEILFYLLIGGLGMYYLLQQQGLRTATAIIGGAAFMCCGYQVGHLQHFNWISGAAFLPWCIRGYLAAYKQSSWRNIGIAVLCFYLFISAAHPGLIIGGIYFFGALIVAWPFIHTQPLERSWRHFSTLNLGILCGLAVLSAGMIIGYADIIPHFIRGEKIGIDQSLSHPTPFAAWLSFLAPLTTVKNDALFNTDISMRNLYIGLTPFLFLVGGAVTSNLRRDRFLLLLGTFFLLLSAGGMIKAGAYRLLPLVGYVRLNGEFRIFAMTAFIMVSAFSLDRFFIQQRGFNGPMRIAYYTAEVLLFLLLGFGLFKSIQLQDSIFFRLDDVRGAGGIAGKLKAVIDGLSFYDCCWLQGMLQLLFLWCIKWCLRHGSSRMLVRIAVADMVIATLLNLPFTGVGKAPVAAVQRALERSPSGIPIPARYPPGQDSITEKASAALIGDWSFYSKQPGPADEAFYPVALKNMRHYFELPRRQRPSLDSPYVFTESGSNSTIEVQQFTPNEIAMQVMATESGRVVLKENYYPHWRAFVNGKQQALQLEGINFMSAKLQPGNNNILFEFDPKLVRRGMLVSLVSFIALAGLLVWGYIRRLFPSSLRTQQHP